MQEYIGKIAVLGDQSVYPVEGNIPEDVRDLTKYEWEWLSGQCNTDYYLVFKK